MGTFAFQRYYVKLLTQAYIVITKSNPFKSLLAWMVMHAGCKAQAAAPICPSVRQLVSADLTMNFKFIHFIDFMNESQFAWRAMSGCTLWKGLLRAVLSLMFIESKSEHT